MEGNEEMKAPATVVCLRRWWVAAISAGAPFFLRCCNGSSPLCFCATAQAKENMRRLRERKSRKASKGRAAKREERSKEGRKEGGAVPACQLVRFGHGSRKLS